MATKTASTNAAQEQDGDSSLLDTQSSAVKKLVAKGRERGCITFDELNAVLPQDKMSSEQIEDIMAVLSEMGIQVVESEESEEGEAQKPAEDDEESDEEEAESESDAESPAAGNVNESAGRTDDPVRMYLREMGTVELLSREGEIAIAKRIEAGRDEMIGGLCESPLTFRAIIS
ncbi:MAG: RNA polymerase sigma factor region1.1 domain-containing protein, partial [Acetobacter okinawensis]